MSRRIGVIIPAAGAGKRLGGVSKPLIEIGGKPVILRLIGLFAGLPDVHRVCIAVPSVGVADFNRVIETSGFRELTEIVEGGAERPQSVRNAFMSIRRLLSDDDLVCIHDAARPLLSGEDLNGVVAAAWEHGAALLASKVKDTLKVVNAGSFCESTIDRSKIFAAQTPQVMRAGLLSKAYGNVEDLSDVTDEIMLMERIGVKAFVVEPRHPNLKITTSEDLDLLRKIIS